MNPILAGILQGVGQAGSAFAQQRKDEAARLLQERGVNVNERLADIQTDKARRDLENEQAVTAAASANPDLSPSAQLMRSENGRALALQLYKSSMEARRAREAAQGVGAAFEKYGGSPATTVTGTEPVMTEGTPTPQTMPGSPPDRYGLLRGLLNIPNLTPQQVTLAQDVLKPREPKAMGEYGLYDQDTKTIIPPTTVGGPVPPPAKGMARATHYDRFGRPTYTDTLEKPERTIEERIAAARLAYKTNPTDETRAALAQAEEAYKTAEGLARARGEGAAGARPISETTANALAAHQNILASVHLLETFTPQEIQTYAGLLNRPLQDVKLALQGVAPGMFGSPDQRYADFKALMGRLEGTAFGEGGKQLTGIELAVVRNYTPNGKEPGGAAEIAAKVKNLKLFTILARDARIQMAKTGREDLDPDMLDRLIRDGMRKAGLPIPGERQSPAGAQPRTINDPLGIRR